MAELVRQAETDEQVIALWLHGRPQNTQEAYQRDAAQFRRFVGRPLRTVKLSDLQAYADSLAHLKPATQARRLNVVKSLLSFAQRIGYLQYNVGTVLRVPSSRDTLAERILTEAQVHTMIALEPQPRNKVLLHLLYASGGRVSEICGLRWKDVAERDGGKGQVTLHGKGGKTRTILLPPAAWSHLLTLLPPDSHELAPVFRSQKGGHLDRCWVRKLVQRAARRAGIGANVSPHWFRHAHASHALDRGAPIHLVKETLGHADLSTTGRYLHARPDRSSSEYLSL